MDPIADMLIRIKNAQAVGKETVSIPFSKMKYEIAKILEREGFVERVKKRGKVPKKRIVIRLKYKDGKPCIHDMKRISKPGRRVYLKRKELYLPKSGYGILILSTSKGIMTSKEAIKENVGGEALCEVW